MNILLPFVALQFVHDNNEFILCNYYLIHKYFLFKVFLKITFHKVAYQTSQSILQTVSSRILSPSLYSLPLMVRQLVLQKASGIHLNGSLSLSKT